MIWKKVFYSNIYTLTNRLPDALEFCLLSQICFVCTSVYVTGPEVSDSVGESGLVFGGLTRVKIFRSWDDSGITKVNFVGGIHNWFDTCLLYGQNYSLNVTKLKKSSRVA